MTTANSQSVLTFSFYQTYYRYIVRVDYCWDRTGHGCPTLCWKLWCFWSATVLHWGTCPPWLKLSY